MNSISRTTKETEGTRKRTGVATVTAAYGTSGVRGTSRSLQDEQRAGRTRLRPLPRALRTRTSDHVALSSGSVRVWGRSPDPATWPLSTLVPPQRAARSRPSESPCALSTESKAKRAVCEVAGATASGAPLRPPTSELRRLPGF